MAATWQPTSPDREAGIYCFTEYRDPPTLHSFPTRRSADLSSRGNVTSWPASGASCRGSASTRITASTRRGARSRSPTDRKSTRLNSSHVKISYAVFCLKKKILLPALLSFAFIHDRLLGLRL